MSRMDYISYSRFTDPGEKAYLLDSLPNDVLGIAAITQNQTVHHNLLAYFEVPNTEWKDMARAWPPKLENVLAALEERDPGQLSADRPENQRVIGGCMLESHFLGGILRSKGVPTRIRAGYFQNFRDNNDHIVAFWEKCLRARDIAKDLYEKDPEEWRQSINSYSAQQNVIDHHIEHWVVEYWDAEANAWRILDANVTFLKAHSDLDVSPHLPDEHFEYAHEAWQAMRANPDYNPDQHFEEPQDGRSHIRSQMLWDFYSLLNHDIAGMDGEADAEAMRFVKEIMYEDLTLLELTELDDLAAVLADDPSPAELIAFYQGSKTLKLDTIEQDPYSYLYAKEDLQ